MKSRGASLASVILVCAGTVLSLRALGTAAPTTARADDPLASASATSAEEAWERISLPTTVSFRGLSAVSADVVWASGTNGTVTRTTDSGKTWDVRVVAGAERLDFRGIRAFDADNAIIMSAGKAEDGAARIYRTNDGGKNWALVFETQASGVFFDSIAFWDRWRGIVLSDPIEGHFVLFRTSDGGATWKQIPAPGLPRALPGEGAFAASNSCIALDGQSNAWFVTGGASIARVFRSNDSGQTWDVVETPLHPSNPSTGLFSVAMRNARVGIAVGGDYTRLKNSPEPNVIVTDDGGRTWRAADEPAQLRSLFLSSVAFVPNKGSAEGEPLVRAVGPAGAVVERAGPSWVMDSGENFNALAIPTKSAAWAVGPKGFVAKFAANGAAASDAH